MFKLLIIFSVLLCIKYSESKPLQYLEQRKGYIPVYIRFGDTPLNEINPLLAEAFHENIMSKIKYKQEQIKYQKLTSGGLPLNLYNDSNLTDDTIFIHNNNPSEVNINKEVYPKKSIENEIFIHKNPVSINYEIINDSITSEDGGDDDDDVDAGAISVNENDDN